MLSKWVHNATDDGAFGCQPAPATVAMPAKLHKDVLKYSFKRHFSALWAWNRGYRETSEMPTWCGTTEVAA